MNTVTPSSAAKRKPLQSLDPNVDGDCRPKLKIREDGETNDTDGPGKPTKRHEPDLLETPATSDKPTEESHHNVQHVDSMSEKSRDGQCAEASTDANVTSDSEVAHNDAGSDQTCVNLTTEDDPKTEDSGLRQYTDVTALLPQPFKKAGFRRRVYKMAHHPLCDVANRHDAANDDDGEAFAARYEIRAPFDINCAGCCVAYLSSVREYKLRQGDVDRIDFGLQPDNVLSANISCFLKAPGGGGQRGQIQTGQDLNFGTPTIRAFSKSRTYQIYSQTENLGIGFPTNARMESVSIDEVKSDELQSAYMSLASAALGELYRVKNGLPSLRGVCTLITTSSAPNPIPDDASAVTSDIGTLEVAE